MHPSSTSASWILAWGGAMLLLLTTCNSVSSKTQLVERIGSPVAVCSEFSLNASKLAWGLQDCTDVWSAWMELVRGEQHHMYRDRELLGRIADEMRERGTPCLVNAGGANNGVGSVTMKHLASWVLARELGCDWVTPVWGRRHGSSHGDANTTHYCHSKVLRGEKRNSTTPKELGYLSSCKTINWLVYFHYDIPSTEYPDSAVARTVEADTTNCVELEKAVVEVRETGLDNLLWDTLVLQAHASMASHYFVNAASWDAFKREVVRDVLHEMRRNFHASSRPWYGKSPACAYTSGVLNFAIHVRLGDRILLQEMPNNYFDLLEVLMGTISYSVQKKGLSSPIFHVFTETSQPCPSAKTGLFDEMPSWPVDLNQVTPCLTVEAPTNCSEAIFGRACSPERSGIFRVSRKSIVLHVGDDVENALSCMIAADGVVMGCSTFGQIAGLFSYGISMFSVSCNGRRTPAQYKMIPPIAIAEQGGMWVPIQGSWRDPRLTSVELFDKVLDEHIKRKGY